MKDFLRKFLVPALLIYLAPLPLQAAFADDYAHIRSLQAAISYNIARFVYRLGEDRGEEKTPLTFCILNNSEFERELDKIGAMQRKNALLNFRRINNHDALYRGCDIAYLSEEDINVVSLARLSSLGVLTISHTANFLDNGGAVYVFRNGDEIAFSVSLPSLYQANKGLSSQVLALAAEVRTIQ